MSDYNFLQIRFCVLTTYMFWLFIADMQTIDTCQAAFLPIGASASLLIMFLFFDSLQMVFAICTAGKPLDCPWPMKMHLLTNVQK